MAEREELERLREVATRAALAAGHVILESPMPKAELKGRADYVTEVDRRAEEAVRDILEKETPGVSVVGEELGGHAASEYWLVDPVDGTVNFLRRFPAVGVSVALVAGGAPMVGAVHAPYLDTTWSAARGRGAEQNGSPVSVSAARPEDAVVGTGFPFRSKEERLDGYLRMLIPALRRFEDLRRPGAVALDLAWVASGVFDGFFEMALSPWDVAAGALLIEEAGGRVSDWSGGDDYLSGHILAGGSAVHTTLVEMAREAGAAEAAPAANPNR